jgi:uncharacterized membrane protein
LKKVGGRAVFISAIITEIFVITVFVLDKLGHVNVAYLWLNLIGCVLVLLLSWIFQSLLKK